jgi:hypothetical protein
MRELLQLPSLVPFVQSFSQPTAPSTGTTGTTAVLVFLLPLLDRGASDTPLFSELVALLYQSHDAWCSRPV